MHRRVALALTGMLVAIGLPALAAPSPGTQGVSVVPSKDSTHRSASGTFVELGTAPRGRSISDAVEVINGADTAQDVLLYGADAIPSRGGGFAFRARTERQTQLGAWLRVKTPRVTLPPRGTARVAYVVKVGASAEGGEYVGGLVAEPVASSAKPGITLATRFAMAVYLRVPGGVPGATPGRGRPDGTLVVTKLDPRYRGGSACPVVSYRNDSQDVLDPSAHVSTDGVLGGSSYDRRRAGAVLPGTSADVQLPCLKRPLGPGRLEVRLKTPQGDVTRDFHATWLPWPFVVSLLLLLLLVLALLTTFLRGLLKRREEEEDEDDSADRPVS